MGILGKAKYYTKKYLGSLGEDYGVYDPSKSVPTQPPAPEGYEYAGTTGGETIVIRSRDVPRSLSGGGGGVASAPPTPRVPEVITEPKLPAPEPTPKPTTEKDWRPVYQDGRLSGFRTGERFVPRELTIGAGGAYMPWAVTPGERKETLFVGEGMGFFTPYTSPTGGMTGTLYEKPGETIRWQVPQEKTIGGLMTYEYERPSVKEVPEPETVFQYQYEQDWTDPFTYPRRETRIEEPPRVRYTGIRLPFETEEYGRREVMFPAEGGEPFILPKKEEIPMLEEPAETGFIVEKRSKIRTAELRGERTMALALGGMGVGVLASVKGTYEFAKQPSKIKGIPKGIRQAFETGLPQVGRTIRQEPFFATGFIAGEIGQAFAISYGVSKLPKLTGYIRTVGKKRIAPERLIEPEVLTGKTTFPTAPTKYHYKKFVESPYRLPGERKLGVWKAVERPWAAETITMPGGYELPGAYVAPSISPHFLRVSPGKYQLFGMGELGVFKRPTALRIYPTGIRKGVKGRIGYAEIPGSKGEIEAVIPPGTQLARIGTEFYSKWGGVRFPIHKYKIAGVKEIKLGKAITAERLFKKYPSPYYVKPTPLITPYYLGYSATKLMAKPYYYKKPESSYKLPYKYPISTVPSYKPPKAYYKKYYKKLTYDFGYGISGYGYPKYPTLPTPKYPVYPYKAPAYPILPPIKKRRKVQLGFKIKLPVEKYKRKFYYQPGLPAMAFDIRAAKIPALAWTGIPLRPKIRKKRRKK